MCCIKEINFVQDDDNAMFAHLGPLIDFTREICRNKLINH